MSNKYDMGKIYRLICGETKKTYIGSTAGTLSARKAAHKHPSSTCEARIFKNPKIELIENFPCETKSELLWRERFWVESEDCVNTRRPIISLEEWKQANTDYRNSHKETAKAYMKVWRAEHPEEAKAYRSEYWIKNRETLKEKFITPFTCECGKTFQYGNKSKHNSTKFHKRFIQAVA